MVQVDVDKRSFNKTHSSEKTIRQEVKIKGLQVAKWYKVTASSFSGARSQTVSVNCQTNPAGKRMSTHV